MEFVKKYFVLILLVVALVFSSLALFLLQDKEQVDFSSNFSGSCNVSVVAINGEIDTQDTSTSISSLRIARVIREFEEDDNLGVVVLMDSGGGTASAAEEISDALRNLTKPSVTFVRGSALSGAYWVASASDHIVALRTAFIGNIGVTSSYLDETKLNDIEGYTFVEIVSGEYKEVGNPNKALTNNGRAYLQEHTDHLFTIFKDVVMTNRGLTEEMFQKIDDAKMYLASEAAQLGLVDTVGGLHATKVALADQLDVTANELVFCEPQDLWVDDSVSY